MIIIKVNKLKVIWKQQFIDDFNKLKWKKILLILIEKKTTNYTIKIEINVKIEKFTHKRSAEIVSEDSDIDEKSQKMHLHWLTFELSSNQSKYTCWHW